jgi:outer membrane lipoprotein-sorting protein
MVIKIVKNVKNVVQNKESCMRKAILVFSAFFLLAGVVSAQTVDEIIAKNIEAKGGLAKIRAIQSIRITGNAEFGAMQAGFVLTQKRGNKMRNEISIQGMTMVQAYDGQNGWQIVPFTGKKDAEPMGADELKDAQENADMDGPLVDYKLKGHKVELIGKEKTEGTDSYHLRLTLKNGNVRDLFLDADSFLEIKTIGKSTRRGTEMVIETALGDYKEVQGLMVPFSMEQHQQGGQGPAQKLTLDKVEFNVPVDDAAFKMPAPAPPAPEVKKP